MTLVVHSPQGGSGKSTIASSIAITASEMGIKTILIDTATYGSISMYFRLYTKGKNNLLRIHKDENINDNLINVINNNLFLIHSNSTYVTHSIENEFFKKIIKYAKENFKFVVIDTSSDLSERNYMLIKESTNMIIPITPDYSSAIRLMQFKELVHHNLGKIQMKSLLNMFSENINFSVKKFESETGIECITKLPIYDPCKFQNYINQGYLIHKGYNRKFKKDFFDLTKKLLKEIDDDMYKKIENSKFNCKRKIR